ncbi:MAG TPA: pyridoxal-phosphate dependent enzyme [Gaiellaceae bacterium]|nr:pyridoxal-phosphate dependent enzyme [Gaiellaceae bacterium]
MIPLEEIRRARERLGDDVLRTPLVPYAPDPRILLKLECLQPVGSFKLRGALSAIRAASAPELAGGVVTASAGNMAQGVAWAAREAGVAARVIAPADAPRAKLDRVEALGAEVIPVSHEEWWQAMVDRGRDGVDGLFVHPVDDEAVMAGNGTIGLELAEDAPEFDTVLIPWGGGGLTAGIASALKALRPEVRVVAVEPETAAPLTASLGHRKPRAIEFRPSWIDGAGGRAVLPGMWERARELVDEAVAVTLDEAADAVRLLASRAHVVAEGAGALALAAALKRDDRCVCVVSGGNVDATVLARVLAGETPA